MIMPDTYKHSWPQILRYIMENAWGNQYAKVFWHQSHTEDYYMYLSRNHTQAHIRIHTLILLI